MVAPRPCASGRFCLSGGMVGEEGIMGQLNSPMLVAAVFGIAFAVSSLLFGTLLRGFSGELMILAAINGCVAFAVWGLLAARTGRGGK